MEDILQTTDGVTFTFEGDHDVNALSVATAIEGLVSLSDAIVENNYSDVAFRLSVRAISPGSLNFVFMAVAQAAQNLLTLDGVQYAKSLMDVIKTAFEVKKFLRGEKPKIKTTDGDKIELESADGSKLTIPASAGLYFFDQRVDRSITNIFNGALGSPGVSGVSITSDGGSAVSVPRSEFQMCATEIDFSKEEAPEKTIEFERKNEFLFVRKPDLLGGTQWGFKSDKNILAEVKDEDFLKTIQSGQQPIYAKTYIIADMKVIMGIGPDGMPDESKCRYMVTKVYSIHSPDDFQMAIEDQ